MKAKITSHAGLWAIAMLAAACLPATAHAQFEVKPGGDGRPDAAQDHYQIGDLPFAETGEEAEFRHAFVTGRSRHLTDPDAALRAYIDAGVIGAQPDARADYSQYYLVSAAAYFLGYPLVGFQTDRMREDGWLGCCIDPGLSIFVQTDGEDAAAQTFARSNACGLRVPERWDLENFGIDTTLWTALDFANQRVISCHQNDME